jgi:hypothetical protein
MTNIGGRPLKFKSVKELQKKIDAYFADCDPHAYKYMAYDHRRDDDGNKMYGEEMILVEHSGMTERKPYTITGLALALDTSRETLLDYEKGKYDEKSKEFTDEQRKINKQIDTFSDAIKRAKLKCQNYTEEYLYGKQQATGAIFSLKNNYKWKDRTETDLTSGGERIKSAPIVISEIQPRGDNADAQAETETSS